VPLSTSSNKPRPTFVTTPTPTTPISASLIPDSYSVPDDDYTKRAFRRFIRLLKQGPIWRNSSSADKTFRKNFNPQILDKLPPVEQPYNFIWVLLTIILNWIIFLKWKSFVNTPTNS
jgi:hypothetical protein